MDDLDCFVMVGSTTFTTSAMLKATFSNFAKRTWYEDWRTGHGKWSQKGTEYPRTTVNNIYEDEARRRSRERTHHNTH